MENNSTNVNQINCSSEKLSYNLDHVYCHSNDNNYISSNPTKIEFLSIIKENKQLKSMILLHLDLIQEQSDQLLSKDKLITSLRQENDTLKQRLRAQTKLPQIRKEPEIILKEPKILNKDFLNGNLIETNNFSRKIQKIEKDCKQIIKTPTTTKSFEYFTTSNPITKQKTILTNDSIIGESNGQIINKIILQKITKTNNEEIIIKVENVESIQDTNLLQNESIEIKDELIDENSKTSEFSEETEISKNQRKRLIYSELFSDTSENSSKIKFSRGNVMTTQKPYVTCGWKETDYHEDLKEDMEQEIKEKNVCLEIPTWEIIETQKCYKTGIKEDLSDDAFLKRHSKFEIDERRRKKWDVQRIREQRTIERLKRRHCKAEILESEQKKVDSVFCSFYPTPDSVKYIQITDELPVQAFGEPIPLLKPCEFSIPWMTNSTNSGSGKIRKRRSYLNSSSPKKRGTLKSTSSSTSTSTSKR